MKPLKMKKKGEGRNTNNTIVSTCTVWVFKSAPLFLSFFYTCVFVGMCINSKSLLKMGNDNIGENHFSMISETFFEDYSGTTNGNNKSKNKTRHAIVVPYRGRDAHLLKFKRHMSDYFQRFYKDRADFDIWIVEQNDDEPFNRAWLGNIGILEAQKYSSDVDCIIFHDVDLFPDPGATGPVPYDYCKYPIRLGNELQHFAWTVPYYFSMGGVSGLSKAHWKQINGMSNMYVGWGGEDDDLWYRLERNGLLNGTGVWDKVVHTGRIVTPPHGYGVFLSVMDTGKNHVGPRQRSPEGERFVNTRLQQMKRQGCTVWQTDGLNSITYNLTAPDKYVEHFDRPKSMPGLASYHHIYATGSGSAAKSLYSQWKKPSTQKKSVDAIVAEKKNEMAEKRKKRQAEKKNKQGNKEGQPKPINPKNNTQERRPPKKDDAVLYRPGQPENNYHVEFLHIPKTGGSAIEKAGAAAGFRWGACHYDHAIYKEMGCPGRPDLEGKTPFNDFSGESPWHVPLQNFAINHFRDDHVFTVVRNPYDRVLSSYYDQWLGFKGGSEKQSNPSVMNTFVRKLLQTPKEHTFTLPQHRFVWDSSKNHSMVQTVLRYENLTVSFNEFMRMKNITNVALDEKPFNPATVGKGTKKLTVDDFDNVTLALIEKKYEKDFEMFGYEKRPRQKMLQ